MAERPKLPFLEWTKWAGLNTKSSEDIQPEEQARVADNTDFFVKYGSVTKARGMSRVLNTPILESGSPVPISWVGFYKSADLAGQIQRTVLIASGTTIRQVNSDGTTTALAGEAGLPCPDALNSGNFFGASQQDDLLFFQNQNPDLIGDGSKPQKFDGVEVQRWGIIAPGSTETVVEPFSDASSFDPNLTNTVVDEATVTQDGDSVKFNKVDTTSTSAFIVKDVPSFNVDTSGEDKFFVWVFIPRGEIKKLAASGRAVSVYISSDAVAAGDVTTNLQRFDFSQGELFEGWNLLTMQTSPAPSGDTGTVVGAPVRTAIISIKLEIISKTVATTVSDIRWDLMFITDEGRLTASEGVVGVDQLSAGDYQYVVTFVSKYGFESNGGPRAEVTISTKDAQSDITAIPVSTDPQVCARLIYRTVADGNIPLFVTRIEDNVTTTFTDTVGDLSLGTSEPPLAGSLNIDHSPPPKGAILKLWKRTIFLSGDPSDPTAVYFTEDNTPEAFPLLNIVQLDSKVTGMYETLSGLVVETDTGKWQVLGDNPDFKFDKVIEGIGCVGPRAAGEARLSGYAIDRDGMYLYDLNEPIKISEVIRDKFDELDEKLRELTHTHHSKANNAFLVFSPNSSGVYDNVFIYQYLQDVQSRADLFNGWWWELKLPSDVDIQDAEEIEDEDGVFHIYAGGKDGMLYELFDENEPNNVNAAGAETAVATRFQSKYIRAGDRASQVGAPQYLDVVTGRVEPRWIELRRSGSGTSCWKVCIETAEGSATDGTVIDSREILVEFRTTDVLRRVSIDGQMIAGEYVRVTVSNDQLNVSETIFATRLYYYLREGQFEVL